MSSFRLHCEESSFLAPFLFSLRYPSSTPQHQSDINCDFFILLIIVLQGNGCRSRFPGGKYTLLYFLGCLLESPNESAKEFVAEVHYKPPKHKRLVVVLGFFCSGDAVPRAFCTRQILHVIWGSITASAHAPKNGCFKTIGIYLSCDPMLSVMLVIMGRLYMMS